MSWNFSPNVGETVCHQFCHVPMIAPLILVPIDGSHWPQASSLFASGVPYFLVLHFAFRDKKEAHRKWLWLLPELTLILPEVALSFTHADQTPRIVTDGSVDAGFVIESVNVALVPVFAANQVNWKSWVVLLMIIKRMLVYKMAYLSSL